MMLIMPAILGSTLFPLFSSREKAGNQTELTAVMRVLFWINGVISILMICSGWFIFPFVFGASFNRMYLLFVLLIPGILSITMNYPMNAWFSAANRISINIRGSIMALTIICAGDLIFLPHYGVLTASVISSAGYFCYYCYTVHMYRKEHKLPWKDFLLIRKSDLNRIRQSVRIKNQDLSPENALVQNSTP
jgi:O-antigen/teichoic acid export membrane protein